jgi:beta-lactamase regulating signal transducer with metallopeptidase domain
MPRINQWFLNDLVPALCRTLLHSLWQGLVVALLAAAVLVCTRRTKAAVRYNCLLFLFGAALLMVMITFVRELGTTDPVSDNAAFVSSSVLPGELSKIVHSSDPQKETDFISTLFFYINKYSFFLVSVWAFFFMFRFIRMMIGIHYIQAMQQRDVHLTSPEWTNWIRQQCETMGIGKPVRLLESGLIKIPAAVGFFKPAILVPVGLFNGLSPSQVEGILRHELAHIKRADYLVNLLQCIADAIFFFNPSMIWLSALIRQEREICCDEMAIDSSTNLEAYVQALLSFEQAQIPTSYAMAFNNGKGQLFQRVKRILLKENNRLSMREGLGLMAGIILLVIGLVSFRLKGDEPQITKNAAGRIAMSAELENALPSPALPRSILEIQDTVPPAKRDTVAKKKFKKIITNKVDDGKQKTEQIIATDKEGTEYRIRKENGQLKIIEINGQTISKETEQQHSAALDAMLQLQQQQNKLRELKEQKSTKTRQLVQQQQALNKRLAQLDKEHQNRQQEILKKQQNILNKKQLLNHQKELFSPSKPKLFKTKIAPFPGGGSPKVLNQGMNPTLAAILQDMKAQQMVADETRFSFTLREGELEVNGKVQPQNIYELFRKKYLKSSGDHFTYFRDGNTTRTEVNIH